MAQRLMWLNVAHEIYLEERRMLRLERRRIRDVQNPFQLRNDDFCKLFRVSKEIAVYLCESLEPILARKRVSGLKPHVQVLVTLRFLAEGSYQRGVGQDFLLPISQPAVSRCVSKVTAGICERLHHWIKFPETYLEMAALDERFRPFAGFSGIVGIIDCTHVSVVTPSENSEGYRNRKGYFSLNTQMICDDRMVVTNVTMYPGSVHDQFIWNYSQAKDIMRASNGAYFLLGDSGYALEPWMMTPLPNSQEGTPEFRYTMSHCRTRNIVERVFGVMKARWRCLLKDRTLHYTPERASKIIVCCVVLHNIMMHHRIPLPDIEIPDEIPHEGHHVEAGEVLAHARRRQRDIIQRYFT